MFQMLPPPAVFTSSWHWLICLFPSSALAPCSAAARWPQHTGRGLQLSTGAAEWTTCLTNSPPYLLAINVIFSHPDMSWGPAHHGFAFLSCSVVCPLKCVEFPEPRLGTERLSQVGSSRGECCLESYVAGEEQSCFPCVPKTSDCNKHCRCAAPSD